MYYVAQFELSRYCEVRSVFEVPAIVSLLKGDKGGKKRKGERRQEGERRRPNED